MGKNLPVRDPRQQAKGPVTLNELLLWNQDQLKQLMAVPEHQDPSLEALRKNAIEVQQEQCQRNQAAISHHNPDSPVKPWMMETFGKPQMVRLRNQAGDVIGVATALEILNAKPVQG